ncbi:MAG: hypothetical protein RSD41_05775 [Kiritimatiellia bacterium]
MGEAHEQEEALRRRMVRHLGSSRASIYLEFALLAPLWVLLMSYALDFTRIILVQQQLEICSRVAADVDSHTVAGRSLKLKEHVQAYLASSIGRWPGKKLTPERVYLKHQTCGMPFQPMGEFLSGGFSDGTEEGPSGVIAGVLSSLTGGLLDLLSFRCIRYLTFVMKNDYAVGATVSARINTVLPNAFYKSFGMPSEKNGQEKGLLIVQSEQTLATERKRYYCYMPNMYTAVVRQKTYIAAVSEWFAGVKKTLGIK